MKGAEFFSFFLSHSTRHVFSFFSMFCFRRWRGTDGYVRARTMGKQNSCLELWKGRVMNGKAEKGRMKHNEREKGDQHLIDFSRQFFLKIPFTF